MITSLSPQSSQPFVRLPVLLLLALALVAAALPASDPRAAGALPSSLPDLASQPAAPLAFVPNRGQTDPQVRFQTQALGGAVFFTPAEVVLALSGDDADAPVVRVRFEGANPRPALAPGEVLPGVVNYYLGQDRAEWHTNLPIYAGVVYHELYPGVELRYDGPAGALKSTFVVAPYADPGAIAWRYEGAAGLQIDARGDLRIALGGGRAPLVERAPVAWQEIEGRRVPVAVRYALRGDGAVGFALGGYDRAHSLTIDPTLEFSSYLGGATIDEVQGVAIDPVTGDIFVAGRTNSVPFPGSPTSVGVTGSGSLESIFVVRIAADGSGTLYRTLIGGSGLDTANGIALSGDHAFVVGATGSNNLPLVGTPYQTAFGGIQDMVALRLDGSGNLVYSTYIGGSGQDTAFGVAARGDTLFIAGMTTGAFPNTTAPHGSNDAIVLKLDLTASPALQYAIRMGGSSIDQARAIAVDGAENAYVIGSTSSSNFPVVSPYQAASGGSQDAFIAKLDADGVLVYSSFLGGSDIDGGQGIAVDPRGDLVYLTGSAGSPSFPTTLPALGEAQAQDAFAFIAKLDLATNTLVYSRLIGGSSSEIGRAVAIDAGGSAYVVGETNSSDFPSLHPLAEMAGRGGGTDAFLARFDPAGNPIYSTRIGGAATELATDVATAQTPQGLKVVVGGYTSSSDFPLSATRPAFQPTRGGGSSSDGFVVQLANKLPSVDLNDGAPATGLDYGPVTWTDVSAPVAIVNSAGLTVSTAYTTTMTVAEVRFVDPAGGADETAISPPDGSAEELLVTPTGGIAASYYPLTGTLRLSGSATAADYEATLRTLAYHNTSEVPTPGERRIVLTIHDALDEGVLPSVSTVDVVLVNKAPTFTAGDDVTVAEDSGAYAAPWATDLSAGPSDEADQTLSFRVTGNTNPALFSAGPSIDADGWLRFTPAPDANGVADITVVLQDDGGTANGGQDTSAPVTFTITVTPVNDPPTGVDDRAQVVAGRATLLDVLANDRSDPDVGEVLRVTRIITEPLHGTAEVTPDGAGIIYTAATDYGGDVSLVYELCDDGGGGEPGPLCATARVEIQSRFTIILPLLGNARPESAQPERAAAPRAAFAPSRVEWR